MLYEIANARQAELFGDLRRIETNVALEQVRKLERMQRLVCVTRARLGLTAATAS